MGVDTYLAVAFWLGIFGLVCRALLMTQDYPRKRSINLGEDVLIFIFGAAVVAWVSILRNGS